MKIKNIGKFLFAVIASVCLVVPCGMTASAADEADARTVVVDKTYITRAVVSTIPIELSSEIRNAASQKLFDAQTVYSVVQGGESVEVTDGNKLLVKAAGTFTIRAEVKDNPMVFEEFSGEAFAVTFKNAAFLTRFDNITVYTQPIKLMGTIELSGMVLPDDCHFEVTFSVVSGPAEIYLGQYLKINGKGEVKVRVSGRYDSSVYAEKTFTVTDPDEGKQTADSNRTFGQNAPKTGGCASSVGGSITALLAVMAAAFVILRKKSA